VEVFVHALNSVGPATTPPRTIELWMRNERLDTLGWCDNMSSAFCRW
jgi:hypothetical protein